MKKAFFFLMGICVVCSLAADQIAIGSADGTSAGLIDAETSELFVDGVCLYDGSDTVTLTQVVALQGDLELQVTDDAELSIGDGAPDSSVIVKALDATTSLVFTVAEGVTLDVYVYNSVSFKASSAGVFPITFRGKGSTVFHIPSGRTISFESSNNTTATHGVFVQVLMDLNKTDVDAGVQQLVFAPWSYTQESENPYPSKTIWIQFGRCSALRFLSYNATGTDETSAGYGTVAFDVSNESSGRMIVVLERGATVNDGRDAGINIWGSLVTGTGEGIGSSAVITSDLRNQVSAHKRAGIKAIVSITDDVAFNALISDSEDPEPTEAAAWLARDASDRRGLVVINRVNSYPALCSNLLGAVSLEESDWAQSQVSRGYQPGFILADNGLIQIRHNLFLEYVACSGMQAVTPSLLAGSGATSGMVKMRNPSAFITDEIGQYSPSPESVAWDMEYIGLSEATIILEGTAGCFFYSGVSADTGDVVQLMSLNDDEIGESLDATIGVGQYDGTFCPILDAAGIQSDAESIWIDREGNPMLSDIHGARCLDGQQVLAVEGACTIKSVLGEFGFLPNGYITFPSIRIDYTGREMGEV